MSIKQQKSDPVCRTCGKRVRNTIDGECDMCYASSQGLYVTPNPEEASPERALAQKILAIIQEATERASINPEILADDNMNIALDDIEVLCKEQLTKE